MLLPSPAVRVFLAGADKVCERESEHYCCGVLFKSRAWWPCMSAEHLWRKKQGCVFAVILDHNKHIIRRII